MACHSTLVATTAQRVQWQGFWDVGVCREAGARVSLNVRVQDMDLALPDACLEIVADGLPLFQGAQLVVDTFPVSVLRRDGVPRQRSTTQDGVALMTTRRRKERVYPELTGQRAAHGLWSWPGKWEAGGLRNAMSSSTSWRSQDQKGAPASRPARSSANTLLLTHCC